MNVEVLRSVADWLADATNGVNAEIDNVTLDAGDSAPTDIAAVLDETRSEILATKQIPNEQATPFVFVWQHGEARFEQENQAKQDASNWEVAVAYFDRDTNAASAARDASYVLRATKRSLNRLHRNANLASRTRNSVIVQNGGIGLRLTRVNTGIQGAYVSQAFIATYNVRDNAP